MKTTMVMIVDRIIGCLLKCGFKSLSSCEVQSMTLGQVLLLILTYLIGLRFSNWEVAVPQSESLNLWPLKGRGKTDKGGWVFFCMMQWPGGAGRS